MGKKKEVKLGTFTIVSKYPKGRKSNVRYIFKYQRTGDPVVQEVEMLWLDFREEPRWAFMDGREADKLTNEERVEFIEEIAKFSKGSSYRRTHPIAYSPVEQLRQQVKQKEFEIYELNKEIEELESKGLTKLCTKYKGYFNEKKLKQFEDGLAKLEEKTGYMLKKKNFAYNTDVVVWDKENRIPVKMVRYFRDTTSFETLDDSQIKRIIQEDVSIKRWLEEQ